MRAATDARKIDTESKRVGRLSVVAEPRTATADAPTLHAIAHSVARILADDHHRMAEQLEQAGITLDPTN